ncbi:MAG: hypothetical protein DCO96_16035 [Fluviicola sp. XM-24bin1]|jgi:sec-independent protein translocase protein TatA|nr:MAG: hypothetical protein DCO96_16035 [Fluviicola sp. XM-24bin1]
MQLIFNDIGGGEIFLILIFILIFFGAKSIPGLARTFGRTIRQVREASSDIQDEIRKSGDEMKKDLNLQGTIRETAEDIRRPLDQYAADLEDSMKYQPPKRPSHVKPMGHNPKEVEAPQQDKNPSIEEKEANPDQPKGEE